jgi:TfoX/Sxy family transcriptional regulator of competence genes
MAYDGTLAARIRDLVASHPDVTEIKMFGGLAFMAGGNMFCGVIKDDLMVRVGPENHDAVLARPGARPMEFTGRPMRGMVFVAAAAAKDQAQLSSWVEPSYDFAHALPAKSASAKSPSGKRR